MVSKTHFLRSYMEYIKEKKRAYRFKSHHLFCNCRVKKAAREQEESNQEGRYPTGQKVEGDHPIAYSRE